MKKLFLVLFLFFIANSVYSAKMSYVSGDVKITRGASVLPAASGFQIAIGDKIVTKAGGRAIIQYADGTHSMIGPGSELIIQELREDGPQSVTLSALKGKIRSKVSKVKPGGKYVIQTPVATAGVRGTDFVVELNTGEQMNVSVLEGEVSLVNISTGQEVSVSKDFSGSVSNGNLNTAKLSDSKKESLKKEWSPLLKVAGTLTKASSSEKSKGKSAGKTKSAEKKSEAKAKEKVAGAGAASSNEGLSSGEEKQAEPDEVAQGDDNSGMEDNGNFSDELSAEINDALSDIEVDKENIEESKNAEFQAGRVIKDRDGQLVRVDQYLFRPDNKSLQFVNIVKRDNKLTVIDATAKFDAALPEKVEDWPTFFDKDGGPGLVSTDIQIKNDNDNIRISGPEDDLKLTINGTEYSGNTKNTELKDGLKDDIVMGEYEIALKDSKGVLTSDKITANYWGLDENGNVLNMNYLTENAANYDKLRNIAAQAEFTSNKFKGGKLDVVIGPDIGFSLLDKIGFSALDSFTK